MRLGSLELPKMTNTIKPKMISSVVPSPNMCHITWNGETQTEKLSQVAEVGESGSNFTTREICQNQIFGVINRKVRLGLSLSFILEREVHLVKCRQRQNHDLLAISELAQQKKLPDQLG